MPKRLGWALLFLWAVGLLTALLVYGQRQLTQFDPNGTLLHRSTSPTFDEDIVSLLKDNGVDAGSIIHVGTTQDCYCKTLTTPHQTQLLNKLKASAYNLKTLNIEEIPALQQLVSTVPALMVVDNHFNLRYLGPYATGYGCFTGKSLVDQVVSYTQTNAYQGAVINADAEGCFCSSLI